PAQASRLSLVRLHRSSLPRCRFPPALSWLVQLGPQRLLALFPALFGFRRMTAGLRGQGLVVFQRRVHPISPKRPVELVPALRSPIVPETTVRLRTYHECAAQLQFLW